MEKDRVTCPKCCTTTRHDAAVRQGTLGNIRVIDVGWKCRKCGYEWGFKLLKGG